MALPGTRGKISAIKAGEEVGAAYEVRNLKARIKELERVLGKKSLENEIFKMPSRLPVKKSDIACTPVPKEDNR